MLAKKNHWPLLFILMAFSLSACSASSNNTSFRSAVLTQDNQSTYQFEALDFDVLDISNCTKGLNGQLATCRAGENILFANGYGNETAVGFQVVNTMSSADFEEPAIDANVPLKLKSGTSSKILFAAYELTGRPYRTGGIDQNGFDSAGYVKWVYSRSGVSINKDIAKQVAGGKAVAKEELRPGDLLVYRLPGGAGYHVGIYSGQGNFLHASPQTKSVTEVAAFGPQFSPYFVGGRRYFDDPKASPLSDQEKMAATSAAVKVALAELGPNDKPTKYTSSVKKTSAKKSGKSTKKSKRSSKRSRR